MREIVPLKIDHYDSIKDSASISWGKCILRDIMTQADKGMAYAGIIDGTVVGIGGISLFWGGVGEAWAIYSDKIKKHPIWVFKATRRILHKIIMDNQLHRIQATCDKSCISARLWLYHLGFDDKNIILQKFTTDRRDCLLMEMII